MTMVAHENIAAISPTRADGLNLLIDQAKKDVKITREISLSDIADFTILREVQKELGLR